MYLGQRIGAFSFKIVEGFVREPIELCLIDECAIHAAVPISIDERFWRRKRSHHMGLQRRVIRMNGGAVQSLLVCRIQKTGYDPGGSKSNQNNGSSSEEREESQRKKPLG